MKIAVQGLGRMGLQIARKLAENGHEVIAHNRSRGPIDEAVQSGAKAAYTKEEVLQAFGGEQVVLWIMLPADIVDAQVDEWLALLPKGSIFVDGGNSDFRRTQVLNKKLNEQGMILIDVGTSGGVWGYQNGFSMMAGSDSTEAFTALEPALKTLALPEGAYHHFGPSGSGHYVKMVHNAIEYGMMESLAEGYRMLQEGPYDGIDLAAAGDVWQHHSVVTSWLNELTRDALRENPTLQGIDGYVAESGEARWTLEVAKDKNIPLPSIQAAFDVRVRSQQGDVNLATKLLAAMRNKFGGHSINKEQ
ncbi:MAG TPA: NADP-dependent phosphogluconate dehydrogenase [Candidatus Saccharimonadales bacterium]|nr:NADP-dependent phosphogluconate dehydrogenase [Candidatus Saccharimonadales bacterium]